MKRARYGIQLFCGFVLLLNSISCTILGQHNRMSAPSEPLRIETIVETDSMQSQTVALATSEASETETGPEVSSAASPEIVLTLALEPIVEVESPEGISVGQDIDD